MPTSRAPAGAAKPENPSGILRFGDCELHVPTRELWRHGERQPLPKRVFDLIAYLIACRPGTASHAEIARAVWGRSDVRSAAIAQTVLHARRATGDDLAHPTQFVSVHGVGYRFAATLKEGVASPTEGGESTLSEVRAAVDEAKAAADRDDHDATLFLAEQAMALAERAGANAQRARAMALASWAALVKGTMSLATRYAYDALRLAEAEDHRAIAAHARVRIAHVLFRSGDPDGALQMIEAVRIPDDVPATDAQVLQLETLASLIYRDLNQFERAQSWCERAIRTSLMRDPGKRALLYRLGAVNIAQREAEIAQYAGDTEGYRQACARGLAYSEAMAADVAEIGSEVQRMCWHGNQGIVLAGLDRLEEAWHHTREARRMLESWPYKNSPWYLSHVDELRLQSAALLSKESRTAEALEEVEPGYASAEAAGRHDQALRFAIQATQVCESAGRFEQALLWVRRSHAAQRRQDIERTERRAAVYQARLDNDSLMRELQDTRARLTTSQAQVQQLSERVQFYERYGAHSSAGLMPSDVLKRVLQQRHKEAVARDLPCYVGRLRLLPGSTPAGSPTVSDRPALFDAAAALIREHLADPLLAIGAWDGHSLLFALDGVGERRALQICAELESKLRGAMAASGLPSAARGRVGAVDLAAHTAFDAAWGSLGREPLPIS